jgi:iron complex transport system ATP-binding protein
MSQMNGGPVLELSDVRYRYARSEAEAVAGVTLVVQEGEHTAILGPNGAGKSTLLRLMLGILGPSRGRVLLWGRPSAEWERRQMARMVGVVAQDRPPDFPLPIREFVELGRNPHLRPFQRLGPADREAVDRAIQATDLRTLSERHLGQLSGGELQRAKLARALAQEPRVLLLDEPTAHLDLSHGLEFFDMLADLASRERLTVVTVTHDLHFASRFAREALLLSEGRPVASGPVRRVLDPLHLERAFTCPVQVIELGDLGQHVVPLSGRGRMSAEEG